MFDKFGKLAGLMSNLPRLQEEMRKFQERLPQLAAEGDAGAGMVKVRVNGRLEVLSCSITYEAMRLNDREMLEDLVAAAINQALTKVRQLLAEESAKMAANIGLPPGMLGGGFPGMG